MPTDGEARAGGRDEAPIISPDGQWIWSSEQAAWTPNQNVADAAQPKPVDGVTSSSLRSDAAAASPRSRLATTVGVGEIRDGERPEDGVTPPSSPVRRRRLALALAGLLVVGAAVAVVLVNRGGSDGGTREPSDSQTQTGQSAIVQPNQVCLYETLAGIDIIRSADSSVGPGLYEIQQTIGSQSPLYLLIGQEASSYIGTINQVGVNAAEAKIDATVRNACAENRNPVLNKAQLSALSDIASGNDADTLGRITYYG